MYHFVRHDHLKYGERRIRVPWSGQEQLGCEYAAFRRVKGTKHRTEIRSGQLS